MAWTAADWDGYQATGVGLTAVDTTAGTITVAGDYRDHCRINQRLRIEGSTGNNGTRTITAVAYAPDATVITLSPAPTDATADGTATFPSTTRGRLARLRAHIQEVRDAITATVSADGTSYAPGELGAYLERLERAESRLQGSRKGLYRGRILRSR